MDPSAPGLRVERIERPIFALRGRRLILDADLAAIYGVSTTRLSERVRRNPRRFPPDFAFLLTEAEFANLKSHSARSSSGWGGRRKPALAFTEHGAVVAAEVLNTPAAVAAKHRGRARVREAAGDPRLPRAPPAEAPGPREEVHGARSQVHA
jgi:ORF6N domain-containing protein